MSLNPFHQGMAAHKAGEPLEANPYPRPGVWAFDQGLAKTEWRNGWKHADRQNPMQGDMFAQEMNQ